MLKNRPSGLRKIFVILMATIMVLIPFSLSAFAEESYQESKSSGLADESSQTHQESQVISDDTNATSSEVSDNDRNADEPESQSSQSTSKESNSILSVEQQVPPEYSPQPTSLEEVEKIINTYEAAFDREDDVPPTKPHWEFEVETEFMPNDYFCRLVEGDSEFGARYYTFSNKKSTFAGQWTGLGTAATPYVITDTAGLQKLAQDVNNGTGYSGVHFALGNDINLNSTIWTPIGLVDNSQELSPGHTNTNFMVSTSKAFNGTFNGSGYTISNFSVGNSSTITGYAADYKGFFGLIENATIQNLTLKNANVNGGSGLGVLVGYATGSLTIENCQITDSSVSSAGGENLAAGGMIGMINIGDGSNVKISQASVKNTTVKSSAAYGRVGGMIGNIRSYFSTQNSSSNAHLLIENSNVSGGWVTSTYYYVGGLLGEIAFYNSGGNTVTLNGNQTDIAVSTTSGVGYYVGGFIGFTYIQGNSPGNTILIENSRAFGNVNSASYYVGGFIGYSESTSSGSTISRPMKTIVRNSYATGNVTTSYSEASNVGGFIGHAHAGDNLPKGTMLIENCYSTGNVSGEGYNVGGFIARPSKNVHILNSRSTGDVFGRRNHIGGFIGYSEGNETTGNVIVENSFSTGNVVGNGYFVGGFIGWLQASQVRNSYSVGSVHSGGASTGGFIGHVSYISKIINSYSAGHVSSTSSSSIGGFIGQTDPQQITITNSYFDGTTSQKANGIGQTGGGTSSSITRLNTRDMTTLSKLSSSWGILENRFGAAGNAGNSASPWYIDNDITYPYLYYQYDGQSSADSNYNLGSVQYSSDNGQSYTPLGQFLTDFSFPATSNLSFKVNTAGAYRAFFPFTHGTSSSNFSSYRYTFAGQSQLVPSSGNFTFTSGTPYSLGSLSKTGIVAFSSSPYAKKTSDRPTYLPDQTNTYTYVGDRVTYSVSAFNYSNMYDWRDIVFTDTLVKGLSLVPGSVELNGTALTMNGGVPSYTFDMATRTLKVKLPDMPKNVIGNPEPAIITFKVDVGSDAASIFPLDPTADNIRNRGDVTGNLFQANTFMHSFTATVDDENTDPVFPKYKVVYDGNGGLSPSKETYVTDGYYLPGSNYTISGNDTSQFTLSGYYFVSWNSAADGTGTAYSAGDELTLDQDVNLYAVWNENPNITFYKVDGPKSEMGEYLGLPDAKFTLYRWEGVTVSNFPNLESGGLDWKEDRSFTTSATAGEEGVVHVKDLELSTSYLMVETTAPTGYELPNAEWLIHISDSGIITIGDMLSGKPAFAIKKVDKLYHIANYTLSQAFDLPDAGGSGLVPLMIVGALLIVIAIIGTLCYRKQRNKKRRYLEAMGISRFP